MATKEVKVKSYTRKTKSGKSVIVRAHTAKHKCSDKGCGSGEELFKRKSRKKSRKRRVGDGSSVDTAFRTDYMNRKGEKVIGDKYFSVDI